MRAECLRGALFLGHSHGNMLLLLVSNAYILERLRTQCSEWWLQPSLDSHIKLPSSMQPVCVFGVVVVLAQILLFLYDVARKRERTFDKYVDMWASILKLHFCMDRMATVIYTSIDPVSILLKKKKWSTSS